MTWWEAIIFGTVQGLTEFLPVSSSGHLVIAGVLLGIETPGVFLEVAVHVATLISVMIVYRGVIGSLLGRAVRRDRDAWGYLGKLGLASIPAAAVGLLLDDSIGRAFDSPTFVGAMLLVTGALLWSTRRALRSQQSRESVSGSTAVWMGIAQAVAILPGISRSGATVVAALWKDVDIEEAAQFSFLMSIPVILGAGVLELGEIFDPTAAIAPIPTAIAFVTAAVAGVLAIRFFVSMLRRKSFHLFAPYVWIVGLGFLVFGIAVQ